MQKFCGDAHDATKLVEIIFSGTERISVPPCGFWSPPSALGDQISIVLNLISLPNSPKHCFKVMRQEPKKQEKKQEGSDSQTRSGSGGVRRRSRPERYDRLSTGGARASGGAASSASCFSWRSLSNSSCSLSCSCRRRLSSAS